MIILNVIVLPFLLYVSHFLNLLLVCKNQLAAF